MVGVVGLLLCGVVFLQVAALRANMDAGDVRRDVRAVQSETANLRAAIERKRADGRIERAAERYGMIRPPIDAVRTIRVPRTRAVSARRPASAAAPSGEASRRRRAASAS